MTFGFYLSQIIFDLFDNLHVLRNLGLVDQDFHKARLVPCMDQLNILFYRCL